jgi:hypothetical protein
MPNPTDQAIRGDDRREVRVARRVERGGQHRGEERHGQQLHESEAAHGRRDRDRAQEQRPSEVGADQDRATPEAIDPGPGDEPDEQVADEFQAAQRGDVERAGFQHVDRRERQRGPGHE